MMEETQIVSSNFVIQRQYKLQQIIKSAINYKICKYCSNLKCADTHVIYIYCRIQIQKSTNIKQNPMVPETNITKQVKQFALNKTVLNDFGFNLSSDEKLYQQLACPFQEDITKAHPLCAKFPQGFQTVQFSFDKVAEKITDQTLYYIFYNVMDEKMQLQAARSLFKKCLKYHKTEKVWVRRIQSKFQYFDITQWKYTQYQGSIGNENFYAQADFLDK